MNRDHFLFGAALGMLAPLIASLAVFLDFIALVQHKPGILFVIALLINLLIARYYYSKALSKTAQGLVLITFIIVIFVVSQGQLSMRTDSN